MNTFWVRIKFSNSGKRTWSHVKWYSCEHLPKNRCCWFHCDSKATISSHCILQSHVMAWKRTSDVPTRPWLCCKIANDIKSHQLTVRMPVFQERGSVRETFLNRYSIAFERKMPDVTFRTPRWSVSLPGGFPVLCKEVWRCIVDLQPWLPYGSAYKTERSECVSSGIRTQHFYNGRESFNVSWATLSGWIGSQMESSIWNLFQISPSCCLEATLESAV